MKSSADRWRSTDAVSDEPDAHPTIRSAEHAQSDRKTEFGTIGFELTDEDE